jgi:hypothetical protein
MNIFFVIIVWTHDLLSRPEHELLVQLEKIKAILRLASLNIDFTQELTNETDDLWQSLFIRIIVGCMLQYSFQEQGVTSETCRWFRQVTVQFEFARFRQSFGCLVAMDQYTYPKTNERTYLHKMIKRRIRILLLLKLVFSIQLMSPIRHKRPKVRYSIQHNIANALHDRIVFLSLVKRVPESCVHCYDVVYVPEDLFQEVCTSWLGYNVFFFQPVDPYL